MPKMFRYRPNFIKLSTAEERLQKTYGRERIDRKLLFRMLKSLGIVPYSNPDFDDVYITGYDYVEIESAIDGYKKGAPVDEIFNIGI